MTHTNDVEAVATGPAEEVDRWGALLRKGKIGFEIRRPCDDGITPHGHAELWVDQIKSERARSIIRGDANTDDSLLW